ELGLFCTVSIDGASRAMTSPDGINWTARFIPNTPDLYSVAWSPRLGLFVAVGNPENSNHVATSPDGITWTSYPAPEDNNWRSVTWAPEIGLFCATATSGTRRVMTSPDGVSWFMRPMTEVGT